MADRKPKSKPLHMCSAFHPLLTQGLSSLPSETPGAAGRGDVMQEAHEANKTLSQKEFSMYSLVLGHFLQHP